MTYIWLWISVIVMMVIWNYCACSPQAPKPPGRRNIRP